MSLNLEKIGDRATERPKAFPPIHDSNIDKIEAGIASVETNVADISSSALTEIEQDTSPKLGGSLDSQGNSIYFDGSVQTPTGSTAAINLTLGNHHKLILSSATGDVTLTLTIPEEDQAGTIIIKQGATARDITIVLSSGTAMWMGYEPPWNTDTSKYRVISYRWDSDENILHLGATEVNT